MQTPLLDVQVQGTSLTLTKYNFKKEHTNEASGGDLAGEMSVEEFRRYLNSAQRIRSQSEDI